MKGTALGKITLYLNRSDINTLRFLIMFFIHVGDIFLDPRLDFCPTAAAFPFFIALTFTCGPGDVSNVTFSKNRFFFFNPNKIRRVNRARIVVLVGYFITIYTNITLFLYILYMLSKLKKKVFFQFFHYFRFCTLI